MTDTAKSCTSSRGLGSHVSLTRRVNATDSRCPTTSEAPDADGVTGTNYLDWFTSPASDPNP